MAVNTKQPGVPRKVFTFDCENLSCHNVFSTLKVEENFFFFSLLNRFDLDGRDYYRRTGSSQHRQKKPPSSREVEWVEVEWTK